MWIDLVGDAVTIVFMVIVVVGQQRVSTKLKAISKDQ